jgi:hypothetical protein
MIRTTGETFPMTSTHLPAALFVAPATAESDELHAETPLVGEEAMRRLRNPFRTTDPGSADGDRVSTGRR